MRASYGANLARASSNLGMSAIVDLWYDEEPLYEYNNPGYSYETGHFTQIVWKGTTEIGCGFATGCTTSNWPNPYISQVEVAADALSS
jgi:hypothetical protein